MSNTIQVLFINSTKKEVSTLNLFNMPSIFSAMYYCVDEEGDGTIVKLDEQLKLTVKSNIDFNKNKSGFFLLNHKDFKFFGNAVLFKKQNYTIEGFNNREIKVYESLIRFFKED